MPKTPIELPALEAEVFVLTLVVEEMLQAMIERNIMERSETLDWLDRLIRVQSHPLMKQRRQQFHPVTAETVSSRLRELRELIAAIPAGPRHRPEPG